MKKMFFVLNPCAGTRKANKLLTEILGLFNRAGYDTVVHITDKQGDAREVVRCRAAQMDLVVCCGGDGTFNETVAGILESGADVPVGYIPAGSTNDFAASLGLSTDIMTAAANILRGEPESYDVGSFNGRYFTYVASFGVFTKTSYSTPQDVKNVLGHTAYLLEGIQELTQLRNTTHMRLELEDEVIEDDFIFGAISNSTSLGGLLTLDPKQVDMRDGLLELLLVRRPKDLTEMAECLQALQKRTYDCKMVTFRSASSIRITTDPQLNWTIDGEMEPGSKEIRLENLHRVIRVVGTGMHTQLPQAEEA